MVNYQSNLRDFLTGFIDKPVTVSQDGFVKCQFSIDKFTFSIDYEILKFFDNNGGSYLAINLNQVYNFEPLNYVLKFYLDNDTVVILFFKK